MRTSTKLLTLALLLVASVLSMAPSIMFLQPAPAAGGPPTPDLLWLKMDEGSGTDLNDSSTGGVNDFYTNATFSGGGLDFNGTSHVAGSGTTAVPGVNFAYGSSQTITISFWLNPDDVTAAQILMESGADWASGSAFLLFITGGQLEARISDSDLNVRTEDTAISATTLVNWLIVLDNSTTSGDVKIYKDGSIQAENVLTSSHTAAGAFTDKILSVMCRNAFGGESLFVGGLLDDLRMWSGDQSSYASAIFAAGAQ